MKQANIPRAMVLMVAVGSVLATAAITLAVLTERATPRAAAVAPDVGAPDALPVLFELPRFTLTDQNGRAFGSDQLDGKVWVADFMFTRCKGVCPMLSANMEALQSRLSEDPRWSSDIRLVSLSVDAEHDTPAILREYARRYHAQPGQWVFLTGEREQVWPLIEDGFKLAVGATPTNEVMPFAHSSKLVLVDQQGRVRAYHDGTTPQGRAALIADLHRLLGE